MEPRELTQDELKKLVMEIAPITFKFTVNKIKKSILNNPEHIDMSLNSFLSLCCAIMGSHEANMLRWLETFYFMQMGHPIDASKLRNAFTLNLYEQLGIKLQ